MTSRKVFPLRLPAHYHGQTKPRRKLVDIERQKSTERGNPELGNIKVSNWQHKRMNSDVLREKKEMLTHVGKNSGDMPDWLQSTNSWYQRGEVPRLKKETRKDWEKFDVLNRRKSDTMAWFKDHPVQVPRQQSVTGKVGSETHSNFWKSSRQVTAKVGSLDVRQFNIQKPQMKVGKPAFIDTYSPF